MEPESLTASSALGTQLMVPATTSTDLATTPQAHAAQNPAEVLAALMDFPGSVALAELLGTQAVLGGPVTRDARSRASALWHETQARLDALLGLSIKPLVGRRAPGLPSVDELWEALTRHGLASAQVRDEPMALRLADELGAPLRSALGLSFRQAQAHLATLRWELTHELRALGPKADQLERLDAAIGRSIQAKVGELLDRMEHAAHLTFAKACQHAVAALPERCEPADLATWVVQGGWMDRYRERCIRMSKALFGHLRRNLEGLIRAAALSEGR